MQNNFKRITNLKQSHLTLYQTQMFAFSNFQEEIIIYYFETACFNKGNRTIYVNSNPPPPQKKKKKKH